MKESNWKKYVFQYVKYHIILKNLKEYGYKGLNQGTKVHHLLSGIVCDKLSTAIATVRAYPDKYEKVFGALISYL